MRATLSISVQWPRRPARRGLAVVMLGAVVAIASIAAGPLEAQVAGAITVYPAASSVEIGSTKQFTAYVPISPNTIVWLVNDVVGGNATVGTISASGLYAPPAVIPAKNVVTIKARSTAFPTSVGTTTLTITRKYPWLWSVSPSPLPKGSYKVSLNGANFAPDAAVLANGKAVTTTYVSATKLTATGIASEIGTILFAVRLPAPGAVTGNTVSVPVVETVVSVALSPTAATVSLGGAQKFTAAVSGASNTGVTWSVNGTAGGSLTVGTINAAGQYTAPSVMPASNVVTIRATSQATASSFAQAVVTLTAPVVVTVAPSTVTLQLGLTQAFAATVTNAASTGVSWSVNGTVGGDPAMGTISGTGLYTAPRAMPLSATATITARSVADGVTVGSATVFFQDPTAITYGRFLDQTTFGPTPQLMAHVKQVGMSAYLDEQFAAPESPWPPVATATRSDAIDAFFNNAVNGPDQLRQRVIFALSEIFVIAMNKNTNGEDIVPWLQLLSRNAFGNYRTLLKEITLDASMGKFLDLANSNGAGMGGANENYPREVMQLFSIGLWLLNPNGSLQLDAQNQPIPAYTQADVRELAKALTGWTYSSATGTSGGGGNYSYYPGPMIPAPGKHNTSMKTVLGHTIGANQTIQRDLDDAVDILFDHPNVGPFIATRLIRALVTSNPSPAYIARIAAVFDGAGGTRGDLAAVVRAIIMDPEARNDTPPSNFGRLRTPMQHTAALSRALNLHISGASGFAYLFYGMNEGILDAPSVFAHYSPSFHIPKSPLFGPEFQIFSPSDAINRFNFFYTFLYNPWPMNPALQAFANLANNTTALVGAVDNALLLGRMSPALRAAITAAMPTQGDQNQRAIAALYLAITSGEYLVQR